MPTEFISMGIFGVIGRGGAIHQLTRAREDFGYFCGKLKIFLFKKNI